MKYLITILIAAVTMMPSALMASPAPQLQSPMLLAVSWDSQCVSSASNYLSIDLGFSEQGLIEQLTFEGFSMSDIRTAINRLHPNWNEQCLKKARNYLQIGGFSKSRLVEQLRYDKFTDSQINYAINRL